MAILTVQQIIAAGIVPSFASAAGGGDSFQSGGGGEHVEVINGGVGSINVTIVAQRGCLDFGVTNAAHDVVVAVANGARKKIRVPLGNQYIDANGRVQLTYSGVSSVTVGVFS